MVTAVAGGSGRGSGRLEIGGGGAAVAVAVEQRSAGARAAAAAAAVDTCGGGSEGDEGKPAVLLADGPGFFLPSFPRLLVVGRGDTGSRGGTLSKDCGRAVQGGALLRRHSRGRHRHRLGCLQLFLVAFRRPLDIAAWVWETVAQQAFVVCLRLREEWHPEEVRARSLTGRDSLWPWQVQRGVLQ